MRNAAILRVRMWQQYGAQWRYALTVAILSLATVGAPLYLFYTLTMAAIRWTEVKLDDLRYGYPRTFQTDGVLMAGPLAAQPVHVVVQNLQGRVWIVVLPEDSTQRVVAIKGPQWS